MSFLNVFKDIRHVLGLKNSRNVFWRIQNVKITVLIYNKHPQGAFKLEKEEFLVPSAATVGKTKQSQTTKGDGTKFVLFVQQMRSIKENFLYFWARRFNDIHSRWIINLVPFLLLADIWISNNLFGHKPATPVRTHQFIYWIFQALLSVHHFYRLVTHSVYTPTTLRHFQPFGW